MDGKNSKKTFFLRKYCSYWLLAFMAITGIMACHNGDGTPDVSGIKVTLQTRRLDRDLATIDTAHIADGVRALSVKYPDFINFYLDTLMGFGIRGNYSDTNAGIRVNLHSFLTHKDYRGLFDTIATHFPDTKQIDADLTKGFQFMKHYYPAYAVPKVIYFTSGLNNWSAITYGTDIVGVGLDMYLGEQYKYYRSVGIPDYIARNLRPESAPVNVFKSIYNNDHPFITDSRDLLDMMVQRGKEQYFLSKVIPFVPAETRLGFTPAQLAWCAANEAGVYNFFVKEQFLYSTNFQKILRYVTDGPEATGMAAESPGNVGSWLGWKMVQAFMEAHPTMKMDDLLAIKDAQQILQQGHYKPR